MAYRIQQRRDTAARWAEMNPILLDGEMGLVTDNPNQYKIGDGVHTWNELPLRGYTGTISHKFGEREDAVVSQKVVSEKFSETEQKLSDIGREVGAINLEINGEIHLEDFGLYKKNRFYININDYSWVERDSVSCALIPVLEAKSIRVTAANMTYVPVVAFLKDDKMQNQTSPSYCSGKWGVYYNTEKETVEYDIPEDCNFLYVMLANTKGISQAPKSLDMQKESVVSQIEDLSKKLENVRETQKTDCIYTISNISEIGRIIEGYRIKNDGTWVKDATHKVVLVKVIGGSTFKVNTKSNIARVVFLKSDDLKENEIVPLCEYTEVLKLEPNQVNTYTLPFDCQYVYSIVEANGADYLGEVSFGLSALCHNCETYQAPFDVVAKNTFKTPLFSCHRGCQTFGMENSLPAMLYAAKLGVWAIESDFRITKDGVVVCIHDDTINRTMCNMDGSEIVGDVYVNSLTYNQLIANYKLKVSNYDTRFPRYVYELMTEEDLKVPTMDRYLEICATYGCVPFIELKEDNGIIEKMNEAIAMYGLKGKCIVSSSQIDTLLVDYRGKYQGTERIHAISAKTFHVEMVKNLGNASIAPPISVISGLEDDITGKFDFESHKPKTVKELVQIFHSLGLGCCFGAIETKEEAIKAIEYGWDFMPTDNLWSKYQIMDKIKI